RGRLRRPRHRDESAEVDRGARRGVAGQRPARGRILSLGGSARRDRDGIMNSTSITTVAGLSLLLAAGCGGSDDNGCIKLADGTCVHETFANPPLLQPDESGVYELELKPTEFTVDGKRQCGRGYNGMYPAPTIETKAAMPGEKRQIRVNLHNRFTKSDY